MACIGNRLMQRIGLNEAHVTWQGHKTQAIRHRLRGIGHKAQAIKYRPQSMGHKAKAIKHRLPDDGHKHVHRHVYRHEYGAVCIGMCTDIWYCQSG